MSEGERCSRSLFYTHRPPRGRQMDSLHSRYFGRFSDVGLYRARPSEDPIISMRRFYRMQTACAAFLSTGLLAIWDCVVPEYEEEKRTKR